MYCMKCGRETKENHVFCSDCLESMAAYPVKPGTPVLLPNRPASTVARKSASRRKGPTAEERLAKLRRTVWWLALSMILVIAALFVTASILVHMLRAQDAKNVIGQNYSTLTEDNFDVSRETLVP